MMPGTRIFVLPLAQKHEMHHNNLNSHKILDSKVNIYALLVQLRIEIIWSLTLKHTSNCVACYFTVEKDTIMM